MKDRDREGFRTRITAARAAGKSLTEAIAEAYRWLLKSARDVWR